MINLKYDANSVRKGFILRAAAEVILLALATYLIVLSAGPFAWMLFAVFFVVLGLIFVTDLIGYLKLKNNNFVFMRWNAQHDALLVTTGIFNDQKLALPIESISVVRGSRNVQINASTGFFNRRKIGFIQKKNLSILLKNRSFDDYELNEFTSDILETIGEVKHTRKLRGGVPLAAWGISAGVMAAAVAYLFFATSNSAFVPAWMRIQTKTSNVTYKEVGENYWKHYEYKKDGQVFHTKKVEYVLNGARLATTQDNEKVILLNFTVNWDSNLSKDKYNDYGTSLGITNFRVQKKFSLKGLDNLDYERTFYDGYPLIKKDGQLKALINPLTFVSIRRGEDNLGPQTFNVMLRVPDSKKFVVVVSGTYNATKPKYEYSDDSSYTLSFTTKNLEQIHE
ncbi:MAG: hypothetical protein LBM27_02575 [Lactobacillaceae bacterium]|jgi:hypothetical protein|nr:hypothetical protein [Lactobacillaceae bacterium]